jgi:putative protein-disulfide isomerase
MEPALRRLNVEFGDEVRFTYVMGGLAREFGPAPPIIADWLEAGERSGMPVDARLWLQRPPASSFPACLAVKAAEDQGLAGPLLRRLREGLMCGRRKLDTTESLLEEAATVPRMNVERFRIDLASHATVEAFGADLDRCAAVDASQHRAGGDRVLLPSVEFRGDDGAVHGVYGFQPYEAYAEAALAAGATRIGEARLDVEDALRRFGPMASAEVAAVCGLGGPRAPAALWALAEGWRARADRRGTGELWSAA